LLQPGRNEEVRELPGANAAMGENRVIRKIKIMRITTDAKGVIKMKNSMEIQQENINRLMELVKANPDLRIVPMVDTECVCSDDYSYWIANWGKAEIDEIWCYEDGEIMYSRSDSYDTLVEEAMDKIECDDECQLEALAKAKVDAYDWEKVITVSIQPYC
jgi:hypothetical protein